MQKTAIKAFVYSFSVSLFAIIAANRAFWHKSSTVNEPLTIDGKNIVLFLKNSKPSGQPTKKISLTALPEIDKIVNSSPQSEPEIILASNPEEIDFPIEFATGTEATSDSPPTVVADILYSPETGNIEPQIDAEPIYSPEKQEVPHFKAPILTADTSQDEILLQKTPSSTTSKEDEVLRLARASEPAPIPLQKDYDLSKNGAKIKIGDPKDLNHIAMNTPNIPIQSMEKEVLSSEASPQESDTNEWKPLTDSPWLVAKSGGGAKNQLAAKELADASNTDFHIEAQSQGQSSGVQVASETVKNLIIPIPNNIMEDEDLTPKLAYPSSSDDAVKERLIDAKIKHQEKAGADTAKSESLLSPIDEEDIVLELDATDKPVEMTPIKPENEEKKTETADATKKEGKDGILNALNSIFTSTSKAVVEAKDKAIAKAQAKRSFRKKLAKTRPVSIMPTEIRLSFQPNRAEISGQTLRWVQAFASKAAESPSLALEIRIDGTSSTSLQQKRLNLLHNILTNKGVAYSQINTVFTTREPNSFILRTISSARDESGGTKRKRNTDSSAQYIQW